MNYRAGNSHDSWFFAYKKDYLVDTILCATREELLELNEKNFSGFATVKKFVA